MLGAAPCEEWEKACWQQPNSQCPDLSQPGLCFWGQCRGFGVCVWLMALNMLLHGCCLPGCVLGTALGHILLLLFQLAGLQGASQSCRLCIGNVILCKNSPLEPKPSSPPSFPIPHAHLHSKTEILTTGHELLAANVFVSGFCGAVLPLILKSILSHSCILN